MSYLVGWIGLFVISAEVNRSGCMLFENKCDKKCDRCDRWAWSDNDREGRVLRIGAVGCTTE